MHKWILTVHGQGFTVDLECGDELEAELRAYELIGRGVRDGMRIYPNTAIVFCELKEKDDDTGI